jgi:NifU-like protein involved in Fe-S cluster formation
MELSDLYSEKILAIAGRLGESAPLADAQASVRKTSRVCGSTVSVSLNVGDGVVSAYSQEVDACALGRTAAAIVAEHIVGETPAELRRLRDEMVAMLKRDGPPPTGERWADLRYLEPVRDYPPRHASVLLVFEAVVACLDRIERETH